MTFCLVTCGMSKTQMDISTLTNLGLNVQIWGQPQQLQNEEGTH